MGGVKPGTHLAKGTLVNKKVTHHELPVTPRVILNPLPRDLALAEFDFMNCEAAMLKVCKLDINWAAEGWGAARGGGFLSLVMEGGSDHGAAQDTQHRAGQAGKAPRKFQPGIFFLDEDGQVPALAEPQSLPLCALLSSSMGCSSLRFVLIGG